MARFCPTEEVLCVTRGDSPVIPVQMIDDQGNPIDITGWTATLTVDTQPEPSNSDTNLFAVSGIIVPLVAPATFPSIFVFQPTESNLDLAPGEFFYDVQILTSVPSKRTPLKGTFVVEGDINKS